jgi:two-component sensor histidine kinase
LDTAISLAMVVNELVTNAVKYACPHGQPGRIAVGFSRSPDGFLLTVRDHGDGLPPDVAGAGGLGMRLVRSLLEQLGAQISVENGGGATFSINIPAEHMAAQP